MPAQTTKDNGLARREQLLDAADRVVRREGPGASMNAIAAEAGITKPILYRHFGDKNGLYQALSERHTGDLLAVMRAALAQPLERRDLVEHVLDTYLTAIEARPQVYRFLTRPEAGEHPERTDALAPVLRQIAGEISHTVLLQVDLGADGPLISEIWGRSITGMVLAAGDWWLDQRPCPRDRMVQALADLLWGRLAAAAQLPRSASVAPAPTVPAPTDDPVEGRDTGPVS